MEISGSRIIVFSHFFQIKQLYSEKEELMTSNKSLAEYNISQEPDIKSKRQQLAEKHRYLNLKFRMC